MRQNSIYLIDEATAAAALNIVPSEQCEKSERKRENGAAVSSRLDWEFSTFSLLRAKMLS